MAALTRFVTALALLASLGNSARAADLPLEDAVKASYLYKFAPFVQWPPAALPAAGAPLTICIAGQDPFGHALQDAVRGQRVNGHPFQVLRIETVRPGIACNILFVAGAQAEEAFRAVASQPVLTVTDRGEGGGGGIIQFVTVGGHVRFTINQAAAEQNGITISSKLLQLAVKVTR